MPYPTRKAILIGCPGGNETNLLSGVKHDLQNVSKYFQSEKGGVWLPREIEILDNPTFNEVQLAIRKSIADYVVVYFSGHGYTDINSRERMICLKDYYISDKYLLSQSLRQLVLVDACRNFSGGKISGIPQFEPEYEYFTGSPVRDLFNEYIMNSPAGKIIVHGTQPGEFSYDSSTGGIFTNALLNIGTRINAEQNYTYASIQRVLSYVPQVLRKQGNSQIPSITYKSGNLNIPFAIGIPQHGYQKALDSSVLSQLTPPVNSTTNGNWALVGLGLLLFFGIAASSK